MAPDHPGLSELEGRIKALRLKAEAAERERASAAQKDRQLYDEFFAMPSSMPESKVNAELAKRHSMTVAAVKAAVRRGMESKSSSSGAEEQSVRAALSRFKVQNLIYSMGFANVSYLEDRDAWNDADVKRKAGESTAAVFDAVFSVPAVTKARVTAFYPGTEGGQVKVHTMEFTRAQYPGRK